MGKMIRGLFIIMLMPLCGCSMQAIRPGIFRQSCKEICACCRRKCARLLLWKSIIIFWRKHILPWDMPIRPWTMPCWQYRLSFSLWAMSRERCILLHWKPCRSLAMGLRTSWQLPGQGWRPVRDAISCMATRGSP